MPAHKGSKAILRETSNVTTPLELIEQQFRDMRLTGPGNFGNVYVTVWKAFYGFLHDPFVDVVQLAKGVVDHINQLAFEAFRSRYKSELINDGLMPPGRRHMSESSSSTLTPSQSFSAKIPGSTPVGSWTQRAPEGPVSVTPAIVSVQARPKFEVGSPMTAVPEGLAGETVENSPRTPPTGVLAKTPVDTGFNRFDTPIGTAKSAPVDKDFRSPPPEAPEARLLSPYTIFHGARRHVFDKGPLAEPPAPVTPVATTTNGGSPAKKGRKSALAPSTFIAASVKKWARPVRETLEQDSLTVSATGHKASGASTDGLDDSRTEERKISSSSLIRNGNDTSVPVRKTSDTGSIGSSASLSSSMSRSKFDLRNGLPVVEVSGWCRDALRVTKSRFEQELEAVSNVTTTRIVSGTARNTESRRRSEISPSGQSSLSFSSGKVESQIFTCKTGDSRATCMAFYPLVPLLAIGLKRTVEIWNWETGKPVCTIDVTKSRSKQSPLECDWLESPLPCSLSCMKVINGYTNPYLLTCSNTGDLKVWDFETKVSFRVKFLHVVFM